MRKIFIDTNVWLRFLIADEPQLFEDALKLIKAVEMGSFRPYTSSIVMLEINYTLRSFYKLPKSKVTEDIQKITKTRNINIIDKTNYKKAFEYYKKYNIKLGDCFVASQLPIGAVLCSFDSDFKKIKEISAMSPKELLSRLSI